MKLLTLLLVGLLGCSSPAQTEPSVRWDQPVVSVYIQQGRALGNEWSEADSINVVNGFKRWESNIPMKFVVVSKEKDADIVVKWRMKFNEQISGRTLTRYDSVHHVIRSATIELALRKMSDEHIDASSRIALDLHEIGHALGMKHNDAGNSIMRPIVQVRDLSDEDVENIKQLYTVPPGTELPSLRSIQNQNEQ